MHLSKSDFLKYQTCPSYFWLWKHKRELVPAEDEEEVAKQRLEQGNEVERYARQLFPDGKLVEGHNEKAKAITESMVKDGATTLFQATVITDNGLLAMADVLQRDEANDGWILYEVKSTNSIKKEHYSDITFQRVAFETAGYNITGTKIVHMNKDYVRGHGEIDHEKLLLVTDVGDEVAELIDVIRQQIGDALERMNDMTEPKGCSCRLLSRGKHCPTFAYFNPDIPEYSVFDITRMQGKKLASLVDDEIFNLADVPDDFKLTPPQAKQVQVAKSGEPIIDTAGIALMLDELSYPLYFLDYESISTALPMFSRCHPYQQVPFQYSLHVLREAGGELEHYEYLSTDSSTNPIEELISTMRDHIGDTGSVIVWHKSFEVGRNKEMATLYPEHADFLHGVNDRVFDLKDIFAKQLYVHPDFKGSCSIKAVLPVLVPEHSYKDLDIQKGDVAAVRWFDAVTGAVGPDEANKTYDDLLKYCRLDTLAMVEIYNHLMSVR